MAAKRKPNASLIQRQRKFLETYDPSLSVTELAERAGIRRKTYYNWLNQDNPWFREQIEKANEQYNQNYKTVSPPPTVQAVPRVEGDWKDQVVAAYVPCFGNLTQAAKAAGVELADVMKASLPPGAVGHSSKDYDPEFAAELDALDPVVKQSMEDQIRHKSLYGGDSSALRWLMASKYTDEYGPKATSRNKASEARVVPTVSDETFQKLRDALRQVAHN